MLFFLLLVHAITIAWWLTHPRQPLATIVIAAENEAPTSPIALPPQTKEEGLPRIVQPYAHTPYLRLADPRWKDYNATRKADPDSEWKTPIEFYGKVVDERDQPVAGADIEFSWNGTSKKVGDDGVRHSKMNSSVNGNFVINGINGQGLSVYVSKDGYHKLKTWNGGSFEYARFWLPEFIEPDRDKPVIFHLLKRPASEPTYRIGERILLLPPVWVTHLDLLSKKAETANGGDITIRIIRSPNVGNKDPFDWELKIEGNAGAEFAESDEEFMLRAPDKGYLNTINKSLKQVKGSESETVRFYVRNKSRRLYAAVSLEISPYYPMINVDKACIIVIATVNPNDSPNVERDNDMDIREMHSK